MARRPSATTQMSAGVKLEGLREVTNALNRLDKEAKDAAKDRVTDISRMMAREIQAAGNARRDPRDKHVAQTVRAKRDRLPVINIGKATRMPVSRRGQGPRASDLMFGMEFGSTGKATDTPTRRGGRPGWRFPERTARLGRGNVGYWIFPTARRQQDRVLTMWANALEDVAREWTR